MGADNVTAKPIGWDLEPGDVVRNDRYPGSVFRVRSVDYSERWIAVVRLRSDGCPDMRCSATGSFSDSLVGWERISRGGSP